MVRFNSLVFPGALGALGALLLSLACQAAPLPASDLPDLLREAVSGHPDVRSRRSELDAARYAVDGAKWGRYPSFSTELQARNSAAAHSGGTPQSIARLEQPLWTGGRITGQIALSDAGMAVAGAALEEAEQSVLQQTAQAYFDLLRFESRLQVALANEAEHQRLLAIIERRVRSEVSPMTDETQAAARMRQAMIERIQTQRQLEAAQLSLAQMVGRPVFAVAAPLGLGRGRWTEAALLDAALQFSPERRRLQAQAESAGAQLDLARAERLPRLVAGVQAVLGERYPGQDRGRAYLALQLQTGAGLSAQAAVQSAAARRQAAQDAILTHERQLTQQVRSAWADSQALGEQIGPMRALLAGSDEIVASYLRQFQVGRKSWLDVLNAQREKTQAYYTLADLEYPLLHSRVRLLLLAGQLNARQFTLDWN
jgi:adhesin transport system outer membrane protein